MAYWRMPGYTPAYTVNFWYLKVVGTIFYKFKLICTSGKWTCKKVMIGESNQNVFFYSERRFEFRRIRDIRVRYIESQLY